MTEPLTIPPSAEVLAARAALDEAVADLDAIAPDYPAGGVTPTWIAYTHQLLEVRLAKDDLHHAIREHYTQLTGIPTTSRSTS